MQKLIKLRHETPVAVYGHFKEYYPDSEELYVYNRWLEEKKLLVILNFTDQPQSFKVPADIQPQSSELYISNYGGRNQLEDMVLKPYEAIVYKWI